MRNEIRQAYESMSPSMEVKKRMLRNIKRKQRRKTDFLPTFTLSQRKWTVIPLSLTLTCLLMFGSWMLISNASIFKNFSKSEPTISFIENWEAVPEKYWSILTKYQAAISEDCTQQKWQTKGLNNHLYSAVDEVTSLGYALLDLNSDGEEELLITDGRRVYELYFIRDDEVVYALRIAPNGYGKEVYMMENYMLFSVETSSFSVNYHIWQLDFDGLGMRNLVCRGVVMQGNDGIWYAGDNDKDASPVSEAEGKVLVERMQGVQIPCNLFYIAEQESNE